MVGTCECGRKIERRKLGLHRIYFHTNAGVIPIRASANPFENASNFSRDGLKRYAEGVFGVGIAKSQIRENFSTALQQIADSNDKFIPEGHFLRNPDLTEGEIAKYITEIPEQ
jgi:hypothetical protein